MRNELVDAVRCGTRMHSAVSKMVMSGIVPFLLAAVAQLFAAEPPRPAQNELRAVCAEPNPKYLAVRETAFYWERQVRPSMRRLLRDQKCTGAREILALIADPEDIRLLVRSAPPVGPFSNRSAYGVVCALLEPRSVREWEFLRSCALNQSGDRWVDAGAIQSLKLIASQRSLEILREVQERNKVRAASAAKAVEYIQSSPKPLSGQNLEDLSERVAKIVGTGRWNKNQNTRFNKAGDKALVDFAYDAGEDWFIYTATFHRIDGLWRLRGVRETLQQFAPSRLVIPPRPPMVIPPPPG